VATARCLFAAWFNCWDFGEIGWQVVGGKVLDNHFHKTDEGTAEIRFGFAAAIDNHANCGDDTAMFADDVDCFLHASAARHNVFDNDELFTRRNLKTASQDELALVLLNKDVKI